MIVVSLMFRLLKLLLSPLFWLGCVIGLIFG
jgi:hypothetical protein